MKKFTSPGLQNLKARFGFLTLVLLVLLAMVNTGRAQFSFAGAQVLPGDYWGSVTNDNTLSTADIGAPSTAGLPPNHPLWYAWTAPVSGEVTLDSQGAIYQTVTNVTFVFVPTNFPPFVRVTNVYSLLTKLDTVMGVYSSGTNVAFVNQVAANDDLYPIAQQNITGQNSFTNYPNFLDISTNPPVARLIRASYVQPYAGPSGLRFNAVGGATYYFVVDTKSLTGPVTLNWAYHSSGIFRLASENIDQTGIVDSNRNALLLYQVSETEADRRPSGTVNAAFYSSTLRTYYDYFDVPGALVTITRVAGSSGRATVDYTTMDGTTNVINNGDGLALAGLDYIPVSGTLVFDDFEMSKTIFIPIIDDFGLPEPNRDFIVAITNTVIDASESPQVSPPRLDPTYYQAVVRILDTDIDPLGVGVYFITNTTPTATNVITAYSPVPTNATFNFQKSNYQVPRDVSDYWGNTLITLYVNRSGTNRSSETVHWSVDAPFVSDVNVLQNALFPLQPGSDYAVPTPAISGGILGANSDFNFPNGYSGTLSFPGGNNSNPQPIQFTVANNGLTAFNKDFKVQIYQLDSNGNPYQSGMVAETTVTILFDDQHPPAGSVDEFYNADFNVDMALAPGVVPLTTPPSNPNPGALGPVNSLVVDASDKTIIAGEFPSYNGVSQGSIARLNTDGSLDSTFNSGSGVDSTIQEFIASVSLTPDSKIVIGGGFSSYDGTQRNGIARLNADGSIDNTFNPGLGVNGTVWAVLVQSDGKVVIGGDFTQVNSTTRKYLARFNLDGTLDSSFDPGTALTGPVYALAAATNANWLYLGGDFAVSGQTYRNIARMNPTNAALDTTFTPSTGPDHPVYALAAQPDGRLLLGGSFTHVSGAALNRLARLNVDGSIDQTNFFSGTGANDTVYSLTLNTNGTFYLGGQFTTINGTHRLGFARLYADGTVDTTFLDTAYNQFAGLPKIYFGDPAGTVFTSAAQSDGNVMIGGRFAEVGGGQYNPEVRQNFTLYGYDGDVWPEPKVRDGVRNRNNVARLIGGATPGPGNVGLLYNNYSANKSDQYLYVSLLRTNGTLGSVSANFSVQPGLAGSGSDYIYQSPAPFYGVAWEYTGAQTRMHSDGLYGTNTFLNDIYGNLWFNYPVTLLSKVIVTLQNNTSNPGNLNAGFQLANPSTADQFYLGGQNIPLAGALGRYGSAAAPFTLVDNNQKPGTFGFASDSYFTTNLATLTAPIAVVRTNGSFGTVSMKYSTTNNGTAVVGTDYTGITNQTLTFLSGVVSNSFNVSVKSTGLTYTNIVEKTVGLKLVGPLSVAGATFGLSNSVLRLINRDFQGYLTLSTNSYYGSQSAGFISFTVGRLTGSKGTISVMYGTTNGTAVSGVDFVGVTNKLTWNDGDASFKSVTIPVNHLNVVGPNKQFGITLFNPTNASSGSAPTLLASGVISNAAMTIINDNSYGTLQFSAPSYLVNEAGGYATINVTRTGGTVGQVSVNYATANGTATSPANYVSTNGTLTFAAGQLSSSFNVGIINDGVADPTPPANFYLNVALSSPVNATLGLLTNVPVQIADAQTYNQPPGTPDTTFDPLTGMNDDVLALALQSNGQIVAGGNFTKVGSTTENYVARLNTDGSLDTTFLNGLSGANAPVRALVNQSNDRILIGGAFTSVNGVFRNHISRLMIDGSLDTSFSVGSGADSTVYALAETFIGGARYLYVGGAFGAISGITRPGIARLNDNGTVDASFATGVGANGPVYALAAYSTNSPNAGKVLVGGAFTTLNGTPLNYLARLNGDGSVDTNFNIGTGASSSVHAIAIQLDGKILIGGTFTNVNGTAVNRIARLNENGSLDTAFVANGGVGASETVLGIAVQADNRIVYVGQFTAANGVTRNGITRLLPSGAVDPTINFGDGANGAVESLVIQPTDGMIVIGGAFTVFNNLPHERIARIYGGSETGSGDFTFTTANYVVNENGVSAAITVRRTGGTSGTNSDGSGNVSVTFTTSDGTATSGVNYSGVVANINFAPGEVLQTVLVPILDDQMITPDLTVNLQLSNPTPGTGLGVQPTALLTIYNTDNAISFSSDYYSRAKNAVDGVATIDIIRQGSVIGTSTVNFTTTTNGTATPGLDYTPTNYLVTFNPGVATVSVKVPIINNGISQGNTTVGMSLTNVIGSLLVAPSNAVLTIIDTVTSPGRLAFAATNYIVSEGDGFAYLTVLRTNGSSGSVSVSYQTIPGTAQPVVNYTVVNASVTFGDGETSKVITVPIKQNNLVQGPVSFSVILSNPTGGALLIPPTNSTVTILDDDNGVFFSAATNYFIETAGFATVFVSRVGGTNGSFAVDYSTTNGTAFNNTNYTAVNGTMNFNPGESIKGIEIPLIYDPRVTGDLNFTVKLSNPGSGAAIGLQSNTVVVITDADAGLSFTNAAMSVLKNAGVAVITVVCSNPSVEPLAASNSIPLCVQYSTADGTAVSGIHYAGVSGTLVFTNGIATNTFTVPIFNNGIIDGDRTFTVKLSNPTPPGQLVAPSNQTVTIVENNNGFRFSSPNYTVLRSGIAASITVLRTGNTNSVASVAFTATNGTALNGQDYFATNGTLVFTNGVLSQSFAITVIANTTVQPDKTVLLQLFNPTNAILVAPNAATLTIHDTSGSLVVPAGSAFAPGGDPNNNGIIDPGESVTLLFGLRVSGGTNASNVSATLLVTNGVTAPSPVSQNYGTLIADGPSTSRAFGFTASGTNSQLIAPTFQLKGGASGTNNLGIAVFTYTLGTWTTSFTNSGLIVINDNTMASPYPSLINVSGIGGALIKATITLTNLSHKTPGDIDALLVAPNQQDVLFMAHVGGTFLLNNATLTFDDAASNSLPNNAQIYSGTNKPTAFLPVPSFP